MSEAFITRNLAIEPDAIAPDGSEVRVLAATARGSMAQFRLPPGAVSKAVVHRTVEEVWFFTRGHGRLWRRSGAVEETITVAAGVSISFPVGTAFQFRNDGDEPLEAIGVTMPPWPGDQECQFLAGPWRGDTSHG